MTLGVLCKIYMKRSTPSRLLIDTILHSIQHNSGIEEVKFFESKKKQQKKRTVCFKLQKVTKVIFTEETQIAVKIQKMIRKNLFFTR